MHRHRPARLGPWVLIAASVGCLAIGDVFYAFGQFGIADVSYLSMFVTVGLALLRLTQGGTLLMTRARLIDLLAGACSVLLVVWVFMLGTSDRLGNISATDVLGALLLIGVAGRLIAATWFNWSAVLLCVGAIGMLSSDIAYGLHPSWWTEAGYMVLYLAWGGAALHPSMVELTAPMPTRQIPWRGHWAAMLGLSVATPPLVLLVEAISGTVTDGVVIAVAGAITLVLTITRLSDSVLLSNRAVARERALREASAALVAAPDEAAVDRAVRAAVSQLLPATEVVVATDDRKLTLEALPSSGAGSASRSWWLSSGTGEAATLVCPLWLEPLAVARPNGGALVVSGPYEFLAVGRDALEVLAGQAALAVDRIALVEAIGRRDSDLYLRAVIRNTADIMLVTDEDQVIRYASPALRELLGVDELPPFTTLADLVHPDDSTHVRRKLRESGDGVLHCALQRTDETQVLVEATYRDLRDDRLVRGFVVTMRDVTKAHDPAERIPHLEHVDELPAWVNRRSAQHKFRY
ncbi:PAS domain-containing protein [Actinoplanes sp. N902-109]|uniref:PAS domain-containing protein n=1 Tax=Actinoplanes sp. (strain N902-109) TaxID=649831 RepID=UPI001E2A0B84|nr:PAS domain-containing protein [Actinoplanes sp. N902-109]